MNLGDKVKFQKELVRKRYSYTGSNLRNSEINELNKIGKLPDAYTRYTTVDNFKVLEGIICGVRTIKYKGFSRYAGYEEGYTFETIENKKVYLVACNMKEFHRVPEEFIIKD